MLILRWSTIRTFLKTMLAGLVLGLASQVSANQCLDLLPYDTVEDGLPSVCQSSFTGIKKNYSCQDYRSGETRYRVLYRGGIYPKAVIQINPDNTRHLVSSSLFGNHKLRCPLKPPQGVPQHAVHRGMGVCQDDNDQLVACSVFEHAKARQTEAYRFMTFYHSDEEPSVSIDAQVAGDNDDAIVAEMAFQIGMSLWDTECCAEQAVKYLEYAYRLFPRAEAYRKAYRHSRASLALRQLD
jgi:hypothetical protein